MKYKVSIIFKHLPHWSKIQEIEAKSEKKALDIVHHMYKDSVKEAKIIK